MVAFVVARLGQMLLALLGISTVMFFLLRLSGDPVLMMLPPDATPEDIQRMRTTLGFDDPLVVQYVRFLIDVLQLDFQESLQYRQPALPLVLEKIPATLYLACSSVAFAVVFGIALGIMAALYRGTRLDRVILILSSLGQAIPTFWLGIMLILLFAVNLQLLPALGNQGASSIILPTVTLGFVLAARLSRLVRSSMLEVLGHDFILVAHAKGLRFRTVVARHAFRNAVIPVMTVVAIDLGHLIGGAVVTETIFAWPGVGRLLIQAVYSRDYPVVQANVFVIAVLVLSLNFIVDTLYGVVDPRIGLAPTAKDAGKG